MRILTDGKGRETDQLKTRLSGLTQDSQAAFGRVQLATLQCLQLLGLILAAMPTPKSLWHGRLFLLGLFAFCNGRMAGHFSPRPPAPASYSSSRQFASVTGVVGAKHPPHPGECSHRSRTGTVWAFPVGAAVSAPRGLRRTVCSLSPAYLIHVSLISRGVSPRCVDFSSFVDSSLLLLRVPAEKLGRRLSFHILKLLLSIASSQHASCRHAWFRSVRPANGHRGDRAGGAGAARSCAGWCVLR